MSDSEDDSSDSSNDFGITPKDELTASFFSIKPAVKSNLVNSKNYSEDESSDDDNFTTVQNNIDLFSEVVKNLEASQRTLVNDEEPQQHYSKDDKSQDIKKIKIEKRNDNISDEINAVLFQGENKAHMFHDDESTDEEKKEEEDVKRPDDYAIPKEGVKITLPGTSMLFKKKAGSKKETNLTALLRRKIKANQIIIEKAARLCWLAYGFYLNRQANDPEIMAVTISLVSTNNCPKDDFNLTYLAKFTKWFRNMFTIESTDNEVIINKETLLKRIAEKKIFNYRELVILYVAILRGIGLHCRLIVSLNPPLVKAYNDLLPKTSAVQKDNKIKEESKGTKKKTEISKKDKKNSKEKDIKNNNIIQNSENARKSANVEAKKRAAEILRSKYSYTKKNKNNDTAPQDNASTSKDVKAASTNSEKINTDPSPRRLRSGKTCNNNAASTVTKQQSNTQTNSENNQSKTKGSKRLLFSSDLSSEEDEKSPNKLKKKSNKTVVKSKHKNEKNDSMSDDEEIDNDNKLKKRQNVWVEVYVESKKSWISINIMDGNVDCVADIYVSKKNFCGYLILILVIV